MNLDEAQKRSAELEEWMGRGLHGADIPAADNVRMAYSLLDLVQEHHRSISLLIDREQCGSAFTLLRPTFETLVRATWLARAAGEKGVAEFLDDKPPNMDVLLMSLRKTEFGPWFRGLYNHGWSAMCSYAHGGYFHSVRRISQEAVEAQYEPVEQVEVVRMAGFLALLAAWQCASISGLTEFAKEAADRAHSWYEDIVGKG